VFFKYFNNVRQWLIKLLTSIPPFNIWLFSMIFIPPFAEGIATFFNISLIYYAFTKFAIPFVFIPVIKFQFLPPVVLKKLLYSVGFVIASLSGISSHKAMIERKEIPISICIILALSGYSIMYLLCNVFGLETWLLYILDNLAYWVSEVNRIILGAWHIPITMFFTGILSGVLSIANAYVPAITVIIIWLITYGIIYAACKISDALTTLVSVIFNKFRNRPMSGIFLTILIMFSGFLLKIQMIVFVTLLIFTFIISFITGYLIGGIALLLITGIVTTISITVFLFISEALRRLINVNLFNPFKQAGIPSEVVFLIMIVIACSIIGFVLTPVIQYILISILFGIISLLINIAITGLPKKLRKIATTLSVLAAFITILTFTYMTIAKPTITHCVSQIIQYKTYGTIDDYLFCYSCSNIWKELSIKYQDIYNITREVYCQVCNPVGKPKEIANVITYLRSEVFKCS